MGKLSAATLANVITGTLGEPLPAALFGLLLGAGLLLVSRSSVRLMTPDDPALGLAKVAVIMVFRMAVVVLALVAYFSWARPGLIPFGTALVGGFFCLVTIELFTLSRGATASEGGR